MEVLHLFISEGQLINKNADNFIIIVAEIKRKKYAKLIETRR